MSLWNAAHLLVLLFIPTNIIKLSQTVLELRPAWDFGFRGDNYIMKTVRVVTLARNIPTGPLLHFHQTLSKYVLVYKSYGLHKISASGEITTQQIKWELSLLYATRLLVLLFLPTKYYQIISNSMGVMACTRFLLQGDNYIRKIMRVVSLACEAPTGPLLHATCLLVLAYIPTKYYQSMSKGIKIMECTRMRL